MKNIHVYISYLVIILNSFLFGFMIKDVKRVVETTIRSSEKIQQTNDSLVLASVRWEATTDSLIRNHKLQMDSITKRETSTINYYEKRIKNLDNIDIVSADSVTGYISSLIYKRRN
jgi:hypothetical protein